MTELTLSAISRYPVKSLTGASCTSLAIDARGFVFDRRWMLIDDKQKFLTQRQHARMTLIRTVLDDNGKLLLSAPGMSDHLVGDDDDDRIEVRVWDDDVMASPVDRGADAWLSAFLGMDCRLVRIPDDVVRPVDPDYAAPTDQVGFADGFPFLLISQGSLDDLNARLDSPVPMARFRPNLVVDGCEPFAEDSWKRIRIGDVEFRVAKPCSRCIVPTIDPASAERSAEPLRTLTRYRKRDNKVYFGQNLIHNGPGRLEVGMPVEVLE